MTQGKNHETAARDRAHSLRRDRRHRHERHRRGAVQSRLYRAGLGRLRERQRRAAARKGHQGLGRPQGRECRRRRRRRGLDRDQARQSGIDGGARAAHSGGAPRRNAGRTDAAEKLRRRCRHPWQDHDHHDGRNAARPALDPTVINGGIINAYGSNARLGAGDWMVVEADESDGTFLKLPSDVVIVTNIDPEHLDHFKTFEAIQDAFRNFVENVPFYGFAVMCTDHPVVQSLVGKIEDRRIITYGENPQADARLVDLTPMGGGSKFKVVFRNRKTDTTHEIADIMLPMPGRHNARMRRRRSRWRMSSAFPTMRSARRSRVLAASSGASPRPANGTASP